MAAAESRRRVHWWTAVEELGATPAAATYSVRVEQQHQSVGSQLGSVAANSVAAAAAVDDVGCAGRHTTESAVEDQVARTDRQVESQRLGGAEEAQLCPLPTDVHQAMEESC